MWEEKFVIKQNLTMKGRQMIDWIRVFFHCLKNLHRNFLGEEHSMCKSSVITVMKNGKKIPVQVQHFCSCGYLNGGVGWEKVKKDMKK
jgi:hypothetical protein